MVAIEHYGFHLCPCNTFSRLSSVVFLSDDLSSVLVVDLFCYSVYLCRDVFFHRFAFVQFIFRCCVLRHFKVPKENLNLPFTPSDRYTLDPTQIQANKHLRRDTLMHWLWTLDSLEIIERWSALRTTHFLPSIEPKIKAVM